MRLRLRFASVLFLSLVAACDSAGLVLTMSDLGFVDASAGGDLALASDLAPGGDMALAPGGNGVNCGATSCAGACCVAGATATCAASAADCSNATSPFGCDGDEDCGGQHCCAVLADPGSPPYRAQCEASVCTTPMCHDNKPCGGGTCTQVPNATYLSYCDTGLADTNGIHCGGSTCSGTTTSCCTNVFPVACSPDSAPTPCPTTSQLRCDGPEDCSAGAVCCVDGYDGSGDVIYSAHCSTAAACSASPFSGLRLCQHDTDCPMNKHCIRETGSARVAHCNF